MLPQIMQHSLRNQGIVCFLLVICFVILMKLATLDLADGKVVSQPLYKAVKDNNFHLYSGEEKENYIDSWDQVGEEIIFVPEDSEGFYEEETETPSGTEQANGRASRPSHDERCPPLPDPSLSSVKLCQVQKCQEDADCQKSSGSNGQFICCFNGCVYSCLPKMLPPKAFDWLEETEFVRPFMFNTTEQEKRQPKTGLTDEDSVTLPGGCHLTRQQYNELLLFRKYDHVQTCSCSKGEVLCQVTTSAPSSSV